MFDKIISKHVGKKSIFLICIFIVFRSLLQVVCGWNFKIRKIITEIMKMRGTEQ